MPFSVYDELNLEAQSVSIAYLKENFRTSDQIMMRFNAKYLQSENASKMFEFIMQAIYLLLLIWCKNEKLAVTELKQYLPKKNTLLNWLDIFTELMFMQQALKGGEIFPLLTKIMQKIDKLISDDLKEIVAAQELSGSLESLS